MEHDFMGNVAEFVTLTLHSIYSEPNRTHFERMAERENTSLETLAAYAVTGGLFENYFLLAKDLPGLPRDRLPVALLHNSVIPEQKHHRIFISYRRDDNRHFVERICDALKVDFGANVLFRDVESMPLGENYRTAIRSVLSNCAMLVVFIGHNWLGRKGPAVQSRLMQDHDPVRLELEVAFELALPVIPLLLDGAPLPDSNELPASLAKLRDFTYLEMRPDPDYQSDLTKLINACRVYGGKDERFSAIPIPSLPFSMQLPVRVLASSAYQMLWTVMQIANGRTLRQVMLEDKYDLLRRCESVIIRWCNYFGIPEDDKPDPRRSSGATGEAEAPIRASRSRRRKRVRGTARPVRK